MSSGLFRSIKIRNTIEIPSGYSRKVRWLPQIGDIIPNFFADTPDGPLSFHNWVNGKWAVIFSHPSAFAPVCTSEIAAFVARTEEFNRRGTKLIGICRASAEDQARWHADLEELFGRPMTIPIIADPEGLFGDVLGMTRPAENPAFAVRKTFLIDPKLRLRMIADYPVGVGRSVDELLRVIDALQTCDAHDVGVGADWQPGDNCYASVAMSDDEVTRRYGANWRKIRDYFRVVADPDGTSRSMPFGPVARLLEKVL